MFMALVLKVLCLRQTFIPSSTVTLQYLPCLLDEISFGWEMPQRIEWNIYLYSFLINKFINNWIKSTHRRILSQKDTERGLKLQFSHIELWNWLCISSFSSIISKRERRMVTRPNHWLMIGVRLDPPVNLQLYLHSQSVQC
jgi:hypothetical protein